MYHLSAAAVLKRQTSQGFSMPEVNQWLQGVMTKSIVLNGHNRGLRAYIIDSSRLRHRTYSMHFMSWHVFVVPF